MTPPRRARARRPRPIVEPPGTRAPLPAAAHRAAYGAHRATQHGGQIGHRCRTCARYTAAITLAATREELATILIDPDPRARWVPGIGRVVEPPITGPPEARP